MNFNDPKYCNKECEDIGPICDFCAQYNFNGVDMYGVDVKGRQRVLKRACYTHKGYCKLDFARKDPEEGCEKFICRNTTLRGKWEVVKTKLLSKLGYYKNKRIVRREN